MTAQFEKNLYWREQHDLNLVELERSCRSIVNYAETNFRGNIVEGDIPLIGDTYYSYNLLLYPLPEIHNLATAIRKTFLSIQPNTDNWWIKCWANVYTNQAYHDWHQHHTHYTETEQQQPSYHGIYCVSGDNTVTSYRNIISDCVSVHIPQTPNQLTVVANHPDWYHRTWPYKHTRDRITVAFNIIHGDSIDPFRWPNHWVPI
jgi:hypothetical protein